MRRITWATMCGMTILTACAVSPEPDENATAQGLSALTSRGLPALDLSALAKQPSVPPAGATTNAPAPQLTQVFVAYVGSTNCGWEEIRSNQLATLCDHGGAQLLAITVEIGYGHIPVARFNSAVLPASANYATLPVCQNLNGQLTDQCTPGQVVVGFENGWDMSGNQGGRFTYQNTSINAPFNTLSTGMNIL